MAKISSQPKKRFKREPTRQIGCRANIREETIINRAAILLNRDRNSFIVVSALESARKVLQAHNLSEEEVLQQA